MKKKEKLFLGGEINLSELDADVQKKYEVAKELGIILFHCMTKF